MYKSGQMCIGHLTMDDIFQLTENITYINKIGGACLYSALGAAVWGANVAMVSRVGDKYEFEELRRVAKEKSINIDYITRKKGNGIKLRIEYGVNNDREFITQKDSGNYYDWAPEKSDIPYKEIEKRAVFHITPIPLEKQLSIVNILKRKQGIVTLDPDILDLEYKKKDLWQKVLKEIDYFLLNEKEMIKFMECIYRKTTKINTPQLIELCDSYSLKNLILKKAERGVVVVDNNRRVLNMEAYPVKCIDSTGAGDAFAGGLGYAISKGKKIDEAIICGCVSSSFAIEEIGIKGLLKYQVEEVKKRYKEMREKNEKNNLYINEIV